jgi:hypothetical protein
VVRQLDDMAAFFEEILSIGAECSDLRFHGSFSLPFVTDDSRSKMVRDCPISLQLLVGLSPLPLIAFACSRAAFVSCL